VTRNITSQTFERPFCPPKQKCLQQVFSINPIPWCNAYNYIYSLLCNTATIYC